MIPAEPQVVPQPGRVDLLVDTLEQLDPRFPAVELDLEALTASLGDEGLARERRARA